MIVYVTPFESSHPLGLASPPVSVCVCSLRLCVFFCRAVEGALPGSPLLTAYPRYGLKGSYGHVLACRERTQHVYRPLINKSSSLPPSPPLPPSLHRNRFATLMMATPKKRKMSSSCSKKSSSNFANGADLRALPILSASLDTFRPVAVEGFKHYDLLALLPTLAEGVAKSSSAETLCSLFFEEVKGMKEVKKEKSTRIRKAVPLVHHK